MNSRVLVLALSLLSLEAVEATESVQLQGDLLAARRQYDDQKLDAVQRHLLEEVEARPADFTLRALLAESFVYRADLLRNDRTIRALDKATVLQYRARQAEWGRQGLPHASEARKLARTQHERARAERLIGELYVHQIDGPLAGLWNGPKALSHIRNALALDPEDAECNRAQGLMFLYNPPINGGDVDRAIETFRGCIEKDSGADRYYVLLSMAFRKKDKLIRAEITAKQALRLNSDNADARHLIEELKKQRKAED